MTRGIVLLERCFEECLQKRMLMPSHDDVVVADGVGEEIASLLWVSETDDLLCAA